MEKLLVESFYAGFDLLDVLQGFPDDEFVRGAQITVQGAEQIVFTGLNRLPARLKASGGVPPSSKQWIIRRAAWPWMSLTTT
jgi:hypothetical protein